MNHWLKRRRAKKLHLAFELHERNYFLALFDEITFVKGPFSFAVESTSLAALSLVKTHKFDLHGTDYTGFILRRNFEDNCWDIDARINNMRIVQFGYYTQYNSQPLKDATIANIVFACFGQVRLPYFSFN